MQFVDTALFAGLLQAASLPAEGGKKLVPLAPEVDAALMAAYTKMAKRPGFLDTPISSVDDWPQIVRSIAAQFAPL